MDIIQNIKLQSKTGKDFLADVFYKNSEVKKPVVIFCHGFKGFKDWGTFNKIGEKFAHEDFVFVKFNFSFNGTTLDNPESFDDLEAFSENNISKEMDDLDTMINWTIENNFVPEFEKDINKLYLVGHSRGGSICILKAAEDPRVKKLVTWSALNDFENYFSTYRIEKWEKEGIIYVENKRTKQQMPMKFQIVEDYYNNKERFDIKKAIQNLTIPFMAVHGTEDESVEFQSALEMKKWNTNIKMELIPNANHTFGGQHPFTLNKLPMDTEIVLNQTIDFLKG